MSTFVDDKEFKRLAVELYKKNLDLFNANRTLTILQKLYQIMAATFKMEDLSQQYIDTIVSDMQFLSGAVVVKYPEDNFFRVVGLTKSRPNLESLALLGGNLSDIKVSYDDEKNVAVAAYKSRKRMYTDRLGDVLTFVEDANEIGKIEKITGIKSTVAYPIIFGARVLGSFLVSMGVEEKQLSPTDNQILGKVATVFGVAMDRIMLYQNLQRVNEKLKELDAQKNEFISLAAHELRAPMTAIKGYLSMILDGDAGKIPGTAIGFLKEAVDGNDRLIRLVNNMLNVSRIEEGRMVYQMGVVNLKQVARSVFNEFAVSAKDKRLQYELEMPESLLDLVYVDQDRIYEVVANLISNAVKYTDVGTVKVRLSQSSPHIIRLEVIDSGRGISPEEQKRIFGKFVRLESSAGKTVGTGLGLYISKLLVEKFGGRIGLVSSPGKGSNFWFDLPVKINS